ncbi:MAG: SMI1/KNR4 family protein [Candidatus Kapabacteria bacterium]|nr:SMI1/KNR4 family protein [Candidatus Kapabacteria bacterium]
MPLPLDLKFIEELEINLGISFPEKYKSKMTIQNGGEIQTDDKWALFPFLDKTDHKRISRTSNHIELETANAKEWDNFPADAVAIGENGFGDLLILLPDKSVPSKLTDNIFIWLHETGEIYELAENIDLIG